jgi:hypothetical protein
MSRPDRNVPIIWVRSAKTAEEAEAIAAAWKTSPLLNQLKEIVENLRDGLVIDNFTDYNTPNWAVIRADKNGQIIAYNEILKLLP